MMFDVMVGPTDLAALGRITNSFFGTFPVVPYIVLS